jgi:hypothetical protein
VAFDAGPAGGITLSPFTTMKCENPGPGKTPPERCDHVTFFEDGLARAIRDNAACAPSAKTAFTVSFVMATDFRSKKVTLFAGKSSSLKREKVLPLLRCIKARFPRPTGHNPAPVRRYEVNVVATYPPSDTFNRCTLGHDGAHARPSVAAPRSLANPRRAARSRWRSSSLACAALTASAEPALAPKKGSTALRAGYSTPRSRSSTASSIRTPREDLGPRS